jgi:hypothetical protein
VREPSLELWRQCREELAQEAKMDRLGQELRPRAGTPHNALVWLFPLRAPRLAPLGPYIVAPIVVFAAVAVTFLWGPKTLARYRYGGFGGPPDEKQRGDCATA